VTALWYPHTSPFVSYRDLLYFLISLFLRPIIDVPRILQLCEGLYASGQPVELFVAPALIPVAIDLFCKRNNFGEVASGSDPMSELDAQREVMLCMLLKVTNYILTL
jgi:hypothetical protein